MSPGEETIERRLGDFRLLTEIGRGGMGVVFSARHEPTGRIVAIKMLPTFAGLDPEAVERFRREAEATSRIRHPGIVPIHEIGQCDGTYWFAMDLVEGPSLASILESLGGKRPEALRETIIAEANRDDLFPTLRDAELDRGWQEHRYARSCALLAARVANALAAAHAQHVVHRDLKPSNILIRPNGQPVLLDFGLSRDLLLETALTRSGETVGTPAYMAPEQAAGRRDADERVDVYGLGATLYEMLALAPPFAETNAGDLMRRIQTEEVPPLRRRNPSVPKDLATIVHTCLAKHPDRRYSSMRALEADLDAFLAGRPVRAREPASFALMLRAIARHRQVVQRAALVLALLTLAFGVVGIANLQQDQSEGRAALDAARAALLEHGDAAVALKEYGRAEVLLDDADLVRAVRRRHLEEAVPSLYGQGRGAVLEEFLRALPAGELDRELRAMLARLAGEGRIALAEDLAAEHVAVRRLGQGQMDHQWRSLPAEGRLPIGEYLLRVAGPGYLVEHHHVRVRRDEESVLVPRRLAPGVLAAEFRMLAGGGGFPDMALASHELRAGELQRLLEKVADPELRTELLPLGWQSDPFAPDRVVTGFSLRQARLLAALAGGHLPSRLEYRFAVGGSPRASRLAPQTGEALGIQGILDDVREFAMGDGQEGAWLVGRPPEGFLAAEDWCRPAPAPETRLPGATLRVARFLPPPEDPVAADAADVRRDALLRADPAAQVVTLELHRNGTWIWTWSGNEPQRPEPFTLDVELPGFRQRGSSEVRRGDGALLQVEEDVRAGGERSLLRWTAAGGAATVRVRKELVATSAARAFGDGYLVSVPVRVGPAPVAQRLVLPADCQILSCDPEASTRHRRGGALHLDFEFPARAGAPRMRPVLVHFRPDGLLTESWPPAGRVLAATQAVLDALRRGDAGALARAAVPGAALRARVGSWRVLDWTAIGPTVGVDVSVEPPAHGGTAAAAGPSLWRLLLERHGDQLLGLGLAPSPVPDKGVIERGVYRHARLRVEVRAPTGEFLVRGADGAGEIQVGCLGDDVAFHLTGGEAHPDEHEDAVLLRLVGLDPGSQGALGVPGPEIELVGRGLERRTARARTWLLRRAEGDWQVERWLTVRCEGRWFLARVQARGAGPAEARAAFRAAEPWFRAFLDELVIR
ncbi:MAG: serine/threonine protein kinase [Planctomycetes bacterium]|nr:serine/threonine protein kinase [Planctomycetota bacterium]